MQGGWTSGVLQRSLFASQTTLDLLDIPVFAETCVEDAPHRVAAGPAFTPPPAYLASRAVSFQEEPEAVAGPLVVLQALPQATVIILHEAPVQNDLQLACRGKGRECKRSSRCLSTSEACLVPS